MGYSRKNHTTITLFIILIIVLGFFCLLLSNNHITYRKNFIIDNENNIINNGQIPNINNIKTDAELLPSAKVMIYSLLITTIILVILIIISMKKNIEEIKKEKTIEKAKLIKTNEYVKKNLISQFVETEMILKDDIKISNIEILVSNSNSKNIRVIIQYKTCMNNIGNKIKIKNNFYDIIERGIVIKDSTSVSKLEVNSENSDVYTISTNKNFDKYWMIDNDFNIKCSYTLNNLVQDQIIKAFVCLKIDNIKYTIYSEPRSTIFFRK